MKDRTEPTRDAADPRKILFATDGSDSATHAQALVASIPWPPDTTIRVLTVINNVHVTLTGKSSIPFEALQHAAEENLAAVTGSLRGDGRTVEAVARTGRPASVIVEEARSIGARLIVVGSRGRGALSSTLLGSVAAEVVDLAPVPVLVARASRITAIVLAHDGSPGAMQAEAVLRAMTYLHHLPVRVVTTWQMSFDFVGANANGGPMIDPATYTRLLEDARRWASTVSSESAARLTAAGLKATGERIEATPAAGIAEAAGATELIVMGTRGQTGLARLFLGSVARGVLHRAKASVLIAPQAVERSS